MGSRRPSRESTPNLYPGDPVLTRHIQALEDLGARSRGRRHLVDRAAIELMGALDEAGIGALLLKGPALTHFLYQSGEVRGYMDVDLLVSPDHYTRTQRVLATLEYENISARSGIDDLMGISTAETWRRGGMPVDLHWRLPGCAAAPDSVWTTLYDARATIELGGRQVAVLGRPGLALHLAIHAAQHGPRDVKAMGDLRRGLERWSPEDWAAAARLAANVGAIEAFAAGLRLLPNGVVMAHDLGLPATVELTWQILNRYKRPRGTFHLQAFVQATGARARADVLRRSLFPTRQWIVNEHPIARRSRGLLAGYLIHLAHAPQWAARAWRFRRRRPAS